MNTMFKSLGWIGLLLVILTSCLPRIPVGDSGLLVYDLRYESNYRDRDGDSVICDNRLTTLTFSFAYSDFSKLSSWEAQLIGLRTGATSSRLVQTPGGGGFRRVGNRIVVNWVLSEGVAPLNVDPQGIVVTPVPQPRIIGRTSLELLVRATNSDTLTLRFPGIPVVDNCP